MPHELRNHRLPLSPPLAATALLSVPANLAALKASWEQDRGTFVLLRLAFPRLIRAVPGSDSFFKVE